jgi:hypothetical protein
MKLENWVPIKVVTAATAIAGIAFGSFLFVDDRHAHADEFKNLKQYTVSSLKEVELDSAMARLETLMNIPIAERRDWQVREIERLDLRVRVMQIKLAVEAPKE